MFLANVRARTPINALRNAAVARARRPPIFISRPLSADSPVPPSQNPLAEQGRVGADEHTDGSLGDAGPRTSIEAPKRQHGPRFQKFGRPGGGGEMVAASIFGEEGSSSDAGVGEDNRLGKDAARWLEQNVVVSARTAEGMLSRSLQIADQTADETDARLRWFRQRLGLSTDVTRKILVKRPALLCKNVEEKLEPKVQWLQESLGFDNEGAASVITGAPNFLQYSIECMESKVTWLAQRLSLTQEEAVEVVRTCPFVLTNSIDKALEPRLQWMQDNLFKSERVLREKILSHPRLIGHGVWSTLAPTLSLLRETIGMDEASAARALSRNPFLFNSANRLKQKLSHRMLWLRDRLGVREEATIYAILRTEPRLLGRTNSRLDMHLEYFQENIGATIEDVRVAVVETPMLLCAGLENFWIPRVAALKHVGVRPSFKKHWKGLLSPSWDRFENWVKAVARESEP